MEKGVAPAPEVFRLDDLPRIIEALDASNPPD
jgi:hypothetical protein